MSNIGLEWKEMPATPAQEVSAAANAVVEQLKERPGRSALVETTKTRQGAKKWRARGCTVAAFPSEKTPGQYDIYAKWPDTDGH